MNEKFIAQIIAELKEAQSQALAIFVQALCQQVDPGRLKRDLQAQISAAQKMHGTSPVAMQMLTQALAAAEAERMIQANSTSAASHPTREDH